MKILVQQSVLLETLDVVGKAIINNPPLPILNAILLEAKNDQLTLAATDLHFGIRSSIQVSVEKEGIVALPGKEFKQIITGLNPGNVSIEQENDTTVRIVSGKISFTLQVYSSQEFPEFPQKPKDNIFFDTQTLQLINQFVTISASNDQTRPVLTSVLIDQSNTCEVVSTDGFRLSKLSIEQVLSSGGQLLLPAKTIAELYRVALKEKIKSLVFSTSQELKQAVISVGKFDFYIRLIEGEFPPYQKIIPQNPKTTVLLSAEELKENLKRALVFSDKNQSISQFIIKGTTLEIKAASPNLGSYSSVIDGIRVTGEETQIAFNTQYVLDFLKAMEGSEQTSNEIKIEVIDSMKPALFSSPKIKAFTYVVMPFRVNG